MEKRKPSHDLEAFKRVCGRLQTLSITLTAENDALQLDFDRNDIAALVRTMDRQMFYKSMTSFSDSRSWQDVYHVPAPGGLMIYLKFRDDVITRFTILSFKEK